MYRVKSTLIGAMLLFALLAAPLTASAATASHSARVAVVSADAGDAHAGVLVISGELLFGGILLMAGSVYALRRSRR